MGSLFGKSKAPALPPVPDTPEMAELMGGLTGVTFKQVVSPDGSTRLVTSQNLTPAEEEQLKQIQTIITNSLTTLSQLSQTEMAINDPAFRDAVEAVKRQGRASVSESFDTASSRVEENLAKRGLTSSTTARQSRTGLASDEATALQAVDDEAILLAEQLRTDQMNKALSALQVGSSLEQQQFANQMAELQGLQSVQSQLFAGDQSTTQLEFQRATKQAELDAQASQNLFGNIMSVASLAAAPFTSGASLALTGAGSGGGLTSLLSRNTGLMAANPTLTASDLQGAF